MIYIIGIIILMIVLLILWMRLINIKIRSMTNDIKNGDPVQVFIGAEKYEATFVRKNDDGSWRVLARDKLLDLNKDEILPMLGFNYSHKPT